MKRYDLVNTTVCGESWREMMEDVDGEYCMVDDIRSELMARIDVTNTLPQQQIALKQLLQWIDREATAAILKTRGEQ